jgi:acyl-CoA synthetase (AMP-forming)/AMP-acid ligase II
MTLAATVREAAARFGERAVMVDPDGTALTYGRLDERSALVAAGMAARGVGSGDVVVLRLPSDSRYLVAYAAAARLGAVTAGINPRLAEPEQAACQALAQPTLVLRDPEELDDLERAGRRAGAVGPLPDDPARPVALVFTSGTTGTPKAAVFCEAQLAAVTRIDVGDSWGDPAAPATPMLAATQFAHVGFTTKLPWYLRLGTTTHVLGRWRAAEALACIARHRIPSIGGIAPQIALMLRDPSFDDHDLSCVETIVMGGAASPPALVREARERFGAAYSIRYSSTESGGCGTGTAFDADDEEALFTVGRPRGGIDVQVRGDDGATVLAEGEVGEVWLRSPTVMARYWRDPDATAATLVDGWLRTGDLGSIDERGLLRLAGRSKEMFIRGGYNVYPAEVEAQLVDHPAVAEVAVVPRPDDVMGEIGVAVVVPADPATPPTLEDLRSFLADRLATFKHPEALRLVDALPLTPMHKVDRRALATAESTGDGDRS